MGEEKNYIYAYTHVGHAKDWERSTGQSGKFWIKVGQTKNPGIDRVKNQLIVAFPNLEGVDVFFHSEPATRPDGSKFTDHDLHQLLVNQGISKEGGEWFAASLDEVRAAIISLQRGIPFNSSRTQSFKMRPEQERAVCQTAEFFRAHVEESPKYLWNAKMRFGKTFTTYQLAKEMGWKRVLVLTYKPAVRSAWRDDLLSHVDFTDWQYVDRDTPADQVTAKLKSGHPTIWFASFQDVTGRDAQGKPKPRNEKLHEITWDCIVIDEFHFGASTAAAREVYDPQDRAEVAIAKMFEAATDEGNENVADVVPEPDQGLRTKFHLHLSGTPFKAITNGEYSEDQVFNWTYIDEQREKAQWNPEDGENPYQELPQMLMYSYKLGESAAEWADGGEFNGFNLNAYFKAKKTYGGYEFEKPNYAQSFLDMITGKKNLADAIVNPTEQVPFPYQAAEFSDAVQHSVWFMSDVAACEAMAALLRKHPFFSKYEIYVAAGSQAKTGAAALAPLKKAIRRSEELNKAGSITLSCGKLMTGVTVAEWNAIFMLRSLKAPESYFQAAFRVQSPWKNANGEIKKRKAFVFEFDPNRALSLIAIYGTELASNAGGSDGGQQAALKDLINFLPIYAIDGGGMQELDVEAILDWAHSGMSANSLARRWSSHDLYSLNEVTMTQLLNDEALLAELEQIEDFRTIRQQAEKIVTNANKLKKAKADGEPKAAQSPAKKAIAKQRNDLRKKLKKVSAKVLIFMYLTDFREEQLSHVVHSLDTDLFLRSTGLSLPSYSKLTKLGIIHEGHMTDAIQKFRYFEKSSIKAMLEAGVA